MTCGTTIAAIATPPGTGGVALLRVSGPDAVEIAARVFRGPTPAGWEPRRQIRGTIIDFGGDIVDDVLLCRFAAPASFTGEEVVEISCHGGIVVTRRILDLLLEAGAKSAGPGEFSERAFANGKMDLTQAEAVMDLISAQTELAAKAAAHQLEGRLGREIESVRQSLIALLAHVEAYIDFPEEDIDPDSVGRLLERNRSIIASIETLIATAGKGRILREGLRTVIVGAPNAGKSSLLNLLLGFDRAIVNEAAGTTRDTIEETIDLDGVPIRLVDTAGIRDADSDIEREGIERSKTQLERAELVLHVIDSSTADLNAISFPESVRVVPILNKSDLPEHSDWSGREGLRLSCFDPAAADSLREHLGAIVKGEDFAGSASLTAINSRHRRCLADAVEHLRAADRNLRSNESPEFVAMDLRAALESVGEVVGKTDVEEILGEIFSTFCIGK